MCILLATTTSSQAMMPKIVPKQLIVQMLEAAPLLSEAPSWRELNLLRLVKGVKVGRGLGRERVNGKAGRHMVDCFRLACKKVFLFSSKMSLTV